MRILMIASEAAPFAKTGGLADVLHALPRALARLGHDVDVVIPRYRASPPGSPVERIGVKLGGEPVAAAFHAAVADGVRVLMVDQPRYYDREHLYGGPDGDYPDNPERFAFLCRAALAWAMAAPAGYDVIHAHDWQAGLVPVMVDRLRRGRPAIDAPPTVFTIHNLAYQGVFDASWLPRLGLGWDLMRFDALEYWGRISLLKGGIVFSRIVTTVSPRFAEEIRTPALGFGFDGILRERGDDLIGILNGIDYDQWDPERDPHLPQPFNASTLTGKAAAKRQVLQVYELPRDRKALARPLVALVSRLVDQKGFDLLAAAADEMLALDATFVLLGTGERRYEDLWRGLAARHPGRVGVRIGFDEGLAHLIEGGADMFLMPSRFEPCGLNQMYSLRYGTVPIVRDTGGLHDTVRDFDPATGDGTGFSFVEYSPRALLDALRRALRLFADRTAWRRLQAAGMRQDRSWTRSAREYQAVYERATTRRGEA
jgi:starch synthase